MATNIITLEDLQSFRKEFFEEMKTVLSAHGARPAKKWLRTAEVRKLLGISHGTIQTLRINGSLPYTKMGGVLYYDYDEIEKILEENKRGRDPLLA